MIRSIPPTMRAGTPDLPAVPRWMQVWIILFLDPILTWAETRIYRLLLTQSPDQSLIQIGLHYDPSAVVGTCAGFHADADGPGAPPTFTIEQLVRAEIVRA